MARWLGRHHAAPGSLGQATADGGSHDTASRNMDWVVVALLAIAGVLLLSSLDNGYLWQDEAETALLARNTLRFGYPRGFDGQNYIDIDPFGYGPGHAWVYSPWLSFYLLAAVFAVAGESTWVARLPFAVLGWLSIYLTWRFVRRLTDEIVVQRLSVALLTFSVPFLLHMRQCRYYAMTTALLVGVCLAYLQYIQRPARHSAAVLGLLLVALFHTNFGTFVPTFAAIAAHHVLCGERTSRGPLLVMCAVTSLLTVPWALFFYRSAFVGSVSLSRIFHHLEFYVRVTNKHLIPLAWIVGTTACAWLAGTRWSRVRTPPRLGPSLRWFLVLMVTVQGLFLVCVPDQRHLRYLIPMFPILAMAEAWWLAGWYARFRIVGAVMVLLAVFTNTLQSTHGGVPLMDLGYELTHRYIGPMEGVVGYLRQHGRPGQAAKIPYDDRTLMFYTDLQVERPATFLQESYPDWVIIRRDWIPSTFFSSAYFKRIQTTYDRIEVNAPDVYWQNREDPGSHQFRTVADAPRIVLYHKRGDEDG